MLNPLPGRLLTVALVAGLCAPAAISETAAPNPFAKVPPMPTACYSQGETFYTKLDAAKLAVHADQTAQEEINAQIVEQSNNGDPMEMAARMQQWMMDNPQEAMAYMQGIQTATAEAPAEIEADQKAAAKFESDRKALIASYKSAMKTLNAPLDARFDAMNKKLFAANGCGFSVHGCVDPPWAVAEYNAMQKDRDTAYAAACPGWWGPTGQFTTHMKRYKDWLTGTHVPFLESGEVHRTNQYKIFGTPAASYRSIEPYRAASQYIDAAYPIYQMRPESPICTAKGCDRGNFLDGAQRIP